MEIVLVFVLIVSGTYLYTLRDAFPWMAPFVVLSYGILISGLSFYQYYQYVKISRKEDDLPSRNLKTLGAGFVWILWLVYGIVFRDVSPLFEGTSIAYFQNGLVMGIILLTYWKKELNEHPVWANGVFFVVVLLLFIPHVDTISQDMNRYVLFSKIFAFYTLYVLTEICHVLEDEELQHNTLVNQKSIAEKYRMIYRTEIKIVQSSWVLLTSKYLILGAIVQLVPLLMDISKIMNRVKEQKILDGNTSDKPVVKRNHRQERGKPPVQARNKNSQLVAIREEQSRANRPRPMNKESNKHVSGGNPPLSRGHVVSKKKKHKNPEGEGTGTGTQARRLELDYDDKDLMSLLESE